MYYISQISFNDKTAIKRLEKLLSDEGIRKDSNLDYICGMYDEKMNLIATGSCFGNTLRCMAVSKEHQGEGLLNEIVTHLINIQFERGNTHLFLYTKCDSAIFFESLGFYEIAHIEDQIVFMENRKNGFSIYLKRLLKESTDMLSKRLPLLKTAALVINANPFTLGHQYLIEKASSENDFVHLFIVSEDVSLIPFSVRKKLVIKGTSHLNNICYHESGPYIISNATFPSYFQKDEQAVIESHAMLDLTVFLQISHVLGIKKRYVGEEPTSLVTGIYNDIMRKKLPAHGIKCEVIPRKKINGQVISASIVRQAIKNNDYETLRQMVPLSTLEYFQSQEAMLVINRIRQKSDVIHY